MNKKQIKEAVHCPTKFDAHKLLDFAHKKGYKWYNDELFIDVNGNFNNKYCFYKEETCYYIEKGEYCSREWYKSMNYKIITVDEFIIKEKIKL